MLSCEFCQISKNIFLQNTSGGCFWINRIIKIKEPKKIYEHFEARNEISSRMLHKKLDRVDVSAANDNIKAKKSKHEKCEIKCIN